MTIWYPYMEKYSTKAKNKTLMNAQCKQTLIISEIFSVKINHSNAKSFLFSNVYEKQGSETQILL